MKRLTLICLLVLCLLPVSGWAESGTVEWFTGTGEVYNSLGEHFSYEIEEDHAVLTQYRVDSDKPQPARVITPDTLGGKPLTSIGVCAFTNFDQEYDGDQVECIVLPEGVTELQDGAFECAHGIQGIELPSTLERIPTHDPFHHVDAEISFPNGNPFYKVEDGFLIDTRTDALLYCNPSAYTLPLPRVRRIEHSALSNYSYRQEILEFPDSVEYIGPYNAYDCVDLQKIIVPGSVIELADRALCINMAKEIILNEGLQKIGSDALFETCDFSITIPSTVTWIGYSDDWDNPDSWVNSEEWLEEDEEEEDEEDDFEEGDFEDDSEEDEDFEEDDESEEDEEDEAWEEDDDIDDPDDTEEYGLTVLNPNVHWETKEEYEARTGK